MTPLKRLVFQVLFWLGLWSSIWVSNGMGLRFLRDYGPTYIFQIILLIALLFYIVPKLLMKQSIIIFLTVVLGVILLCSYASMALIPLPDGRPPMMKLDRSPPLMESRFFIQLLILSFTAITAVLIEIFIFAQQKERSEALIKAELTESELKFLKMQINPHFLFNALNNIYALSVTNSDKTQEGISRLSEMLRYVLYDCEQSKVHLQKEVVYITHFIELFKLKSSEKYNISLKEEVDNESMMIAPMLFIPFIENAFKHSGIEGRGDRFLNISLRAQENIIDFQVENSLPKTTLITDAQGGIGIQNVRKRLNILYPQNHTLEIVKDDTFKVRLKIDLN